MRHEVTSGLLAGLLMLGPLPAAAAPGPGPRQDSAAPPAAPSADSSTDPATDRATRRAARRTPVVEVFEASRDAVVSISSTEIIVTRSFSPLDGVFEDLFDMPSRPRTRERQSVGSGFVIHPDGYIVTNAHVVVHTNEQKVMFADGREYEARIVASDSARDLAVLKVDADAALPTLTLGRSDDLMIGETVVAIGNPLGYQHTVTAGVVSATDRAIQVSPQLAFRGLIQTDASINPGNSGGPLLNVQGELIGVNSAIRGDAQNIGFAIPVDQLREVLPELLNVERRYRIDSGLAVDPLRRPRVTGVRAGSPADQAGIRAGDVLMAIDGRPVTEGIDFDIALINRRPFDVLELTLLRDQRSYRTRITLEPRPAPDGVALARERMGVSVEPLPRDIARDLGLRRDGGMVVMGVEPGGPADVAGITRHDVILALGRYYVSGPEDLGRVLEAVNAGAEVGVRILRVDRRGKTLRQGPIRLR